MKVLWITNVAVPDSPLPGHRQTPFGGWISSSFEALTDQGGVELTLCAPGQGNRLEHASGERADHVLLPGTALAENLRQVLTRVAPDLVHIHGTEFPHADAAAAAALQAGVPAVVSIQGLMAPYADAFYHGIPATARYGFTARDLLRRQNTWLQRRHFIKRGRAEQRVLEQCSAAIGRTTWDRDCLAAINPSLRYFHCNETLRSTFYGPRWSPDGATPYSLFLSQGGYPLKGAHTLLEALPLVLRRYPQTTLTIAGPDPTHHGASWAALRRTSYGQHLNRLIERLGVGERVRFAGLLDAEEMRDAYLSSHVYVIASSAENSPNSLGEAMLLGMPTVASWVGGIPSLASADHTGFFSCGDHRSLAARVIELFGDPALCRRRGQAAHRRAMELHHPSDNAHRLTEIYSEVLDG